MKIRADFVTNSSSSSFITLTVTTKQGGSYEFNTVDSILSDEYSFPEITKGKIVYDRWIDEIQDTKTFEITSVAELMETLFSYTGVEKNEEYENMIKAIKALTDIEKVVVTKEDASWDEDNFDEDQIDEDGFVTTADEEVLDMRLLDAGYVQKRESEMIEEAKERTRERVSFWNLKDDVFPFEWEFKINKKDSSEAIALLEELEPGDSLKLSSGEYNIGEEFISIIFDLYTENGELLIPSIRFPVGTADVNAEKFRGKKTENELESLGVTDFCADGDETKWFVLVEIADYVYTYFEMLQVKVKDVVPLSKRKANARNASLTISIEWKT